MASRLPPAAMATAARPGTGFRWFRLVVLAGLMAYQAEGWGGQACYEVSQLLPNRCGHRHGRDLDQHELYDSPGRLQYVNVHEGTAEGPFILQESREPHAQVVGNQDDQGATMGSISEGSPPVLPSEQKAVSARHWQSGQGDATSCLSKSDGCRSGASSGVGTGHPDSAGRRGQLDRSLLRGCGFARQVPSAGPPRGPQAGPECKGPTPPTCLFPSLPQGFRCLSFVYGFRHRSATCLTCQYCMRAAAPSTRTGRDESCHSYQAHAWASSHPRAPASGCAVWTDSSAARFWQSCYAFSSSITSRSFRRCAVPRALRIPLFCGVTTGAAFLRCFSTAGPSKARPSNALRSRTRQASGTCPLQAACPPHPGSTRCEAGEPHQLCHVSDGACGEQCCNHGTATHGRSCHDLLPAGAAHSTRSCRCRSLATSCRHLACLRACPTPRHVAACSFLLDPQNITGSGTPTPAATCQPSTVPLQYVLHDDDNDGEAPSDDLMD